VELGSHVQHPHVLWCAGKVYFEYIGTGKTCGSSNCPAPDRVNTPSIINQIPIPKSGAPLYFLVFLLSDQIGSNIGSGISSGQFGPVGLFASGTKEAPFWDATQIGYLASRGKVSANTVRSAIATVSCNRQTSTVAHVHLSSNACKSLKVEGKGPILKPDLCRSWLA
jgi:hypothetical protein